MRILLMQSLPYRSENTQSTKYSIVDRMMLVRLFEFSKEITELYDKFDLKGVYEATQKFIINDITDFYLDFSKYRRRRLIHGS